MPPPGAPIDPRGFIADVAAAVGARHTRTDGDILAPFLVDERQRDLLLVRSPLIPSLT